MGVKIDSDLSVLFGRSFRRVRCGLRARGEEYAFLFSATVVIASGSHRDEGIFSAILVMLLQSVS
jgi:hypothetical protein